MVKMEKHIFVDKDEGLATVTLSGLKDLNLLNADILNEFADILSQLEKDKTVKVVIITGKGEKSFCSGTDLHVELELTKATGKKWSELGQKIARQIETLSHPVIGAINGYALGGGMEIAIACDILIATENAMFALPEAKHGIIPGWGGTQRLMKLIGKGKTMEMILTGDMIDAQEAYRLGLVNKLVKKGVLEEAKKLGRKIIENGPISIKLCKKLINESFNKDIDMGLKLESQYFAKCFSTEDQKVGMKSFFEKRKPVFKGK
jgi:enoyl-CoA hydratase